MALPLLAWMGPPKDQAIRRWPRLSRLAPIFWADRLRRPFMLLTNQPTASGLTVTFTPRQVRTICLKSVSVLDLSQYQVRQQSQPPGRFEAKRVHHVPQSAAA